jgi:rsbT co-antagonist protein RsbR
MNDHPPVAAAPARPATPYTPEEEHMDQEADRPATDEEPEQRDDQASDKPSGERSDRDDERADHRPRDDARDDDDRDDDHHDDDRDDEDAGQERTEDDRDRAAQEPDPLLQELVAHLRDNRTDLREEWARRISEAELLGVMSDDEIFSEATEVYDNYVDALETGSIETLQDYARELSERIIPRGVETDEVLGIVLLLRDVLARALFAKYQEDFERLNRILDSYEPAANRIAVTVGVSFVEERERVIHEQQESIRELSTPVLQLRERLLILPIIGVLDSARARQLTEQLLGAIQEKRARVVVIDITGVATIDRSVANHLVQTVEASRLMGAQTILTGLSSEIAQTVVDLGVDLGMMKTVGDLQGGLEEAERLAGYRDADSGDWTDEGET